jgi:hypothetical protein
MLRSAQPYIPNSAAEVVGAGVSGGASEVGAEIGSGAGSTTGGDADASGSGGADLTCGSRFVLSRPAALW